MQTATASDGLEGSAGDREKNPLLRGVLTQRLMLSVPPPREDDASAQTGNTSLVDGNDSDDSDAPFDDATDTDE